MLYKFCKYLIVLSILGMVAQVQYWSTELIHKFVDNYSFSNFLGGIIMIAYILCIIKGFEEFEYEAVNKYERKNKNVL